MGVRSRPSGEDMVESREESGKSLSASSGGGQVRERISRALQDEEHSSRRAHVAGPALFQETACAIERQPSRSLAHERPILEDVSHERPGSRDPDRAPGRRLRAARGASTLEDGRPEHRVDVACRVLPELPLELAEGGGRRAGRPALEGGEPDARLRHALRRVEGAPPGRGQPRPARAIRQDEALALEAVAAPRARFEPARRRRPFSGTRTRGRGCPLTWPRAALPPTS